MQLVTPSRTVAESGRLSLLERELQFYIDNVSQDIRANQSQEKQDVCKRFERELCHKMRLLRRWRSGATVGDFREFENFLARARRLVLSLRMAFIYGHLEKMDYQTNMVTDCQDSQHTVRESAVKRISSCRDRLACLNPDIVSRRDFELVWREVISLDRDLAKQWVHA